MQPMAGGANGSDTSVGIPAGRSRAAVLGELATLAGFCAYLFFFGLGSFGLVGADEPRYAQIAREMLLSHDWITPTLNGVPWLEKPALYYWCAILSYKFFGVSDWAARIPSAAFATAMAFCIYAFLWRSRRLALDGSLIAASSAAIIGFARGASTDMPLTATFTVGMLAWLMWRETDRKIWIAAFYLMMALGTLAKGPVAPVLAGAIIVLFAILWRGPAPRDSSLEIPATRWRLVAKTLWIPGILLFIAVTLPWYVAVQIKTHNFFQVFILQHNLERFGTNLYRHKQPFWYYGPVFLLSVLPWTVYVITAIVDAVRREIHSARAMAIPPVASMAVPRTATEPPLKPGLSLFLLLWIAVPLALFTISESKLPGYILPAIPPCAILFANWHQRRLSDRASLPLAVLHAVVCGLLLGGTLLAPYFIVRQHPPAQAISIAVAAAAVIAVAMILSLRFRGLRVLRFVTLVPVVLAMAFVLRVSAPVIDRAQSARPVADELQRLDARGAQLAAFHVPRELEYGLDFYRNQPVMRYERHQVPAGDHLLIARTGSEPQLEPFLAGRRLSHVGGFAPQRLEFYWVSTGMAHHHPTP